MRSLLPSAKNYEYQSVVWRDSKLFKDVKYAVRRPSLAQRIELTSKVQELMLKYEFLKAGEEQDQLSATLTELLVQRLYLEWGLVEVQGLKIDGKPPDVPALIDLGPEELSHEIAQAIKAECGLTEEERKNS